MDSTEKLLQDLLTKISVEDASAVLNEMMRQQDKEKIVEERFGKLTPYLKKKDGQLIEYWKCEVKVDGKRLPKIAKTKKDLVDKLYASLSISENTNITVRELFQKVHAKREEEGIRSSLTLLEDVGYWNRFLEGSELADMKVKDVKASDIEAYSKKLVGRGLVTRKTYTKAKTLLNMIFDEAVSKDLLTFNPSRVYIPRGLRFALPKDNSEAVYTPQERAKLLAYLKTQPQTVYTLAVRLAFCLCVRIGELRALTWDDYDEESQMIHVWREIVREAKNGKKRVDTLVDHTKSYLSEGERYVPVSKEAREVLDELRKINGDKVFIIHGSQGAKFAISGDHFNAHLRTYCEAIGIRYLSSHKIRFYGVTALYKAGIVETDIQRIAGQKNVLTTRHYNRSEKKISVDAEKWEKVFGSTEVYQVDI
jgi:integrase